MCCTEAAGLHELVCSNQSLGDTLLPYTISGNLWGSYFRYFATNLSITKISNHENCILVITCRYVDRFRKAPPTDRISRETPSYSFWWKRDHVINLESHVTPPKAPQDHSTPESSTKVS